MALTNLLVNQILGQYFTTGQYIGLHISDPTTAGLATTELSPTTMPSYARQPVIWTPPLNRAVVNANLLQWLALPAVTVGYLGVWDAVTGGNLLAVMECIEPFEIILPGSSIHLPPSTIGVTLGDSPRSTPAPQFS
jgi:hypothetical protein